MKGRITPSEFGQRKLPLWVVILGFIGLSILVLPLLAILLRAPWGNIIQLWSGPQVGQAFWLSIGTSAIATLICLIVGIPLALILQKSTYWALIPRRLFRAAITVPLVLPPVIGGIALLLLLGRRGLLGQPLYEAFGIGIPFTTGAVVIAQVFVSLPFLVFAVESSLASANQRLELAASTLGASRAFALRTITLPLIAPGIAAGATLSFTRSLGEFGATITFAGSFPGVTRTLPIASFLAMESNPTEAIAMALLLLLIAIVSLLLLKDHWMPGVRS